MKNGRIWRLWAYILTVAFALLLLTRLDLYSQVTTGMIAGEVTDASGALVPGATVIVSNESTSNARTVNSDEQGRYAAPNLQPGSYTLTVSHTGFQTTTLKGIELVIGQTASINVSLTVGEVTETISVVGETPLVESANSTVVGLVSETQMRELPLNVRSFDQLFAIQAGIKSQRTFLSDPFSGRSPRFYVAGARNDYNLMMIDGTIINNYWNFPSFSTAGTMLGVDAIREFNILSNNYTAEYGRVAGGVMNAITRSGGNNVHGSAYEFFRNDVLDAKNFFDLPNEPIPAFRRNQFGVTAGGPIVKNKTFFFANYEGLRERLGLTRVATVPNKLAQNGYLPDPSRPGQLLNVGVDSGMKPFLAFYPLPNGQDFGNGTGQFTWGPTQPTREDMFIGRVDHQFSSNDLFFGSYLFDDAVVTQPYNAMGGQVPGFPQTSKSRGQFLTSQYTKILSPTWMNTARFGYARTHVVGELQDQPSSWVFLPDPGFKRNVGLIQVPDLSAIGGNAVNPFEYPMNLFQYNDDVSYSHGYHLIKFGFDGERIQLNHANRQYLFTGLWNFNSLKDLLQNNSFTAVGAYPGAKSFAWWRQTVLGFYFQDQLRLSSHLTLNAGLRYEFVTNPYDATGKKVPVITDLDTSKDVTLAEHVYRENPSLKNFAPRVGLVWDPFGDGKTALRAGFGIFYNQLVQAYYFDNLSQPPYINYFVSIAPKLPNALSGFVIPLPLLAEYIDGYRINKTPHMLQYNVGIQRQLTPDLSVTLNYVGSRGIDLTYGTEANPAQAVKLSNGRWYTPPNARPRNPNFGPLAFKFIGAKSFYNSFELRVDKRFSKGFQLNANYTLSKSIDDASRHYWLQSNNSPEPIVNPFDLRANRSLSDFDQRHSFVVNYVWDLPFKKPGVAGKLLVEGWELSGISSVSSGIPFTVMIGYDHARSGSPWQPTTPDFRPGVKRSQIVLGGPDRYFDTSAFVLPPAGVYGISGRNQLTGPGLVNFDFSVIKTIYSRQEGLKIQFRAEMFNLFNRPNFAPPNNTSGQYPLGGTTIFNDPSGVPVPTAAKIFSTLTPSRQIQFGLKLTF